MNEYKMTAESYEMIYERDKNDPAKAEFVKGLQRDIKVLRILAELSQEEIDAMFDMGAFNSILKGYLELAMKEAVLPEETRTSVRNGLRWMLDTKSAAEARQEYEF